MQDGPIAPQILVSTAAVWAFLAYLLLLLAIGILSSRFSDNAGLRGVSLQHPHAVSMGPKAAIIQQDAHEHRRTCPMRVVIRRAPRTQ